MPILPSYIQFGGCHPETAAMTNALAAQGVTAPHTGQPYTEAMLLGLGGGLGAGYILWEFKAHPTPVAILVVGFRNNWQYPIKFMEAAAKRLKVATRLRETGGRALAAKQLRDALEAGMPAIAWVDLGHLPYLQLPEGLKGHIGHLLAVCGQEADGAFWVDDRAAKPYRVSADGLADAQQTVRLADVVTSAS